MKILLSCRCTDPNHSIIIQKDLDDLENLYYIHVGMAKVPFLKRLALAFKYILGVGYSDMHYQETIVNEETLIEALQTGKPASKARGKAKKTS